MSLSSPSAPPDGFLGIPEILGWKSTFDAFPNLRGSSGGILSSLTEREPLDGICGVFSIPGSGGWKTMFDSFPNCLGWVVYWPFHLALRAL